MPNDLIKRESEPLAILLRDPEALKAIPMDTVRELVALHERVQKERARQEFAAAMNRIQGRTSAVKKGLRNPQTGSMYADLEAVERMLLPILQAEGVSFSQSTEESKLPKHLRVVLIVRHIAGHEERHYLDAPIDDVGLKGNASKTPLHGMGSTLTYCLRYLLCMVFGVRLTKDDDGSGGFAGPGSEKITQAQADDIRALMQEVGGDEKRFLAVYEVARIEDLSAACFRPAIKMLESKRKPGQGGAPQTASAQAAKKTDPAPARMREPGEDELEDLSEPMADTATMLRGVPTHIAEKPTKSGGKRYGIKIGETYLNTFDKALRDFAVDAMANKRAVIAYYTEGKYGKDCTEIKNA